MSDDLARRLDAVERAVVEGETDLADISDAAALEARLSEVEARLDEVATRLDRLDAGTQALRGYLGGIDAVSADVEQRVDIALAKAEAVERAVFDADELAVERLPTVAETRTKQVTDSPAASVTGSESTSGSHGSTPASASHGATTSDDSLTGSPTPPSSPESELSGSGPVPEPDRSLVSRLRDAL